MMTASDFADAIGRKKLADALDVGASAVSNAVVRGWFPSSWFVVSKNLAEIASVECPPELFGMRGASQNVDCAGQSQREQSMNVRGQA